MKDLASARELARIMVNIGKYVGRETVAYITNMDQPLGLAIGNSLEVAEAVQVLRGEGSRDLVTLCLELGSTMLVLGRKAKGKEEAKEKLQAALTSGAALEKFREFIVAQGGDGRVVDDLSLLPQARFKLSWTAEEDVYLADLPAARLGQLAMELGAGRQKKDDQIDVAVGIVVGGKIGDRIGKGQPIATIYANDEAKLEGTLRELKSCIQLSSTPVSPPPLIFEEIYA